MRLKKGQKIDVYLDYQNNKGYLGKAQLVEFINHGLPYILEEDKDPRFTVTFRNERWRVCFITEHQYPLGFEKICNIRSIHKVGITSAGNTNLRDIDVQYNNIAMNDFLILENYDTSIWDQRVDETQVSGQMY